VPGGRPRLAGNTCSQSCILVLICGEFGSMPTASGSKIGLPRSRVRSGQFGTPRERMHRANFNMSLRISCTTAGLGGTPGPPFGRRCPQAWVAAWNRGFPAASSTWLFAIQWEKASGWEVGDREFVDPPAFDAPDDEAGEPPHAAASKARPAVALTAAALCTLRSRARRRRRAPSPRRSLITHESWRRRCRRRSRACRAAGTSRRLGSRPQTSVTPD